MFGLAMAATKYSYRDVQLMLSNPYINLLKTNLLLVYGTDPEMVDFHFLYLPFIHLFG